MLLHIKHVHTWDNCPAHNPEKIALLKKVLASGGEKGVRVISATVDAPAHTFFFMLEADSMEHVTRWFEPLLEWGQGEVDPVTDLMATSNMMETIMAKK
jgi:hypothetical protein